MNSLSTHSVSTLLSKKFSRLLPKSLLLAALLAPAVPVQTASASAGNTLYALAGATVITGVAYGAHWLYASGLYNRTSSRYELPIAIVAAYANNPNDHESLYKELIGLINVDNVTWSSASSRYHNYPLVEFVADLNLAIQSLSSASLFTMPTQLSSDMQVLKQQLQRVRYYCIRHPAYIDQRRRADELAAHTARHVVVH